MYGARLSSFWPQPNFIAPSLTFSISSRRRRRRRRRRRTTTTTPRRVALSPPAAAVAAARGVAAIVACNSPRPRYLFLRACFSGESMPCETGCWPVRSAIVAYCPLALSLSLSLSLSPSLTFSPPSLSLFFFSSSLSPYFFLSSANPVIPSHIRHTLYELPTTYFRAILFFSSHPDTHSSPIFFSFFSIVVASRVFLFHSSYSGSTFSKFRCSYTDNVK